MAFRTRPFVVYELQKGKMVKVAEPSSRPEQTNFVIVCTYGDWSGFRTLAECERQFPELEGKHKLSGTDYWVEDR